MKKLLFILVVVMLTGYSAVFAQNDDDSALDFPILEEGVVITDEFGDGVFARLYAFSGTEGDLVSVGMAPTQTSEVDPYLVLLGQDGQVYMTNDDAEAGSPRALIDSFELPETGTYLVLATAWDTRLDQSAAEESDRDLDYVIGIEGNNVPANAPITISRGELEIGMSGALELTGDAPIFYVMFPGEEGNVVTISAQSEDVDTLLYLFDEEGNRVAVNDDRQSGNLASAIEDFELPEDGNYLVFVMAFNFYEAYQDDIVDTGRVNFAVQ
ncbi:MAG: hypothetical protein RLP44_24535 [Aggregatilineales bacterium]